MIYIYYCSIYNIYYYSAQSVGWSWWLGADLFLAGIAQMLARHEYQAASAAKADPIHSSYLPAAILTAHRGNSKNDEAASVQQQHPRRFCCSTRAPGPSRIEMIERKRKRQFLLSRPRLQQERTSSIIFPGGCVLLVAARPCLHQRPSPGPSRIPPYWSSTRKRCGAERESSESAVVVAAAIRVYVHRAGI